MSSTTLFQGSRLSEFLDDKHDTIERLVAKMTTANALDEAEASFPDKYSVTPVALDRAGAKFTSTDVEAGNHVTITVGFTGDTQLFSHVPDGISSYSRPYGQINDYRNWLSADKTRWVRFEKTFKGAPPDEVRAWAKDIIDKVEATLQAQVPQIEAYNLSLGTFVRSTTNVRRDILKAGEDLKGGLGTGI